eukprot:TRINITY_DN5300_c1_g4_i1.p1 TRINITY_DN5300_c1_g4~~TRINITY_DN5300_c1_g4_i1.p1  ORF type:complete len:2216 (-),score=463.01 TRINITY_DN5300_c1_g4_i1:52-5769(-)
MAPLGLPHGVGQEIRGKHLNVFIVRLMDVPRLDPSTGRQTRYVIKAFDAHNRQVGHTPELGGGPRQNDNVHHMGATPGGANIAGVENIVLGTEGTMRFFTADMLVFLQLEHITGKIVGKCHIDRRDPRCTKVTAYSLEMDGHPAHCGLELRIVEDHTMPEGFEQTDYHGHLALVGQHPGQAGPGRLQVRINAATDLKNTDTGLLGMDVSDPYVVVRVGKEEHKTPTINNNLNPVWSKSNVFMFNVFTADAPLELIVMNSNFRKADVIGRLSVPLRNLHAGGSWQKFRERLLDGNRNSQIEFDLIWDPPGGIPPHGREAPLVIHGQGDYHGQLALPGQHLEYKATPAEGPYPSLEGSHDALKVARPKAPWEYGASPQNIAAAQMMGVGRDSQGGPVIKVSRILDVKPRPPLKYCVRVMEGVRELAATGLISSRSPSAELETLDLGQEGILHLQVDNQLIHLQVEYSDSTLLGRCHIHRLDPRSATANLYALSDISGHPANCGIEVQLLEEHQHQRSSLGTAYTGGMAAHGTGAMSGAAGILHIRILAGHQLRNHHLMHMADRADPFVIIRMGGHERKTPPQANNPNPVWHRDNLFELPVGLEDGHVEIEAMNSSMFVNSSLGKCHIALWSLQPGQWQRMREPLTGGQRGDVEFDIRFEPNRVHTEKSTNDEAYQHQQVQQPAYAPTQLGLFGLVPQKNPALEYEAPTVKPEPLPQMPVEHRAHEALMPAFDLEAEFQPDMDWLPTELALPAFDEEADDPHAELWAQKPKRSGADKFLALDLDDDLHAVDGSEAWRVPAMPNHDPLFKENVFPDMDIRILLRKEEGKDMKGVPLSSQKTQVAARKKDSLPEFTLDKWVEDKPLKPQDVVGKLRDQAHAAGAKKAHEPPAKTTLTASARVGDTKLQVKGTAGFGVGDVISVGGEHNTIRGFGSILLASPLQRNHPPGTAVTVIKARHPLALEAGGRPTASAGRGGSSAQGSKTAAPHAERRKAKLKVDLSLVPSDVEDFMHRLLTSQASSQLDPMMEPDQLDIQVVGCLEVGEQPELEKRVWVRTPQGVQHGADLGRRWLEDFQSEELHIGVSCRRGKRSGKDPLPNQDNFSLTKLSDGACVYVLCDGHGPYGHMAACRVVQSLPKFVADGLHHDGHSHAQDHHGRGRSPHHAHHARGGAQPEKVIVDAFKAAHLELERWAGEHRIDLSMSGTSVVLLLQLGPEVQVAWAGDSRVIVGAVPPNAQKPSVEMVSHAHLCEDPKEAQRLKSQGGVIRDVPQGPGGRARLLAKDQRTPCLLTSRAIGNHTAHELGVRWMPDIKKMSFGRNPGLVVLTSGGLFDALADGKDLVGGAPGAGYAVHFLAHEGHLVEKGAEKAARILCGEAQARWQSDTSGFTDDASSIILHWVKPAPPMRARRPTAQRHQQDHQHAGHRPQSPPQQQKGNVRFEDSRDRSASPDSHLSHSRHSVPDSNLSHSRQSHEQHPAHQQAESRRLQGFNQGLERARQEAQRKHSEDQERRRQAQARRHAPSDRAESMSRSPSPADDQARHGSAPPAHTTTSAWARVGDTKLQVESTAGFGEGDVVSIGGKEQNTIRGFGSILLASPLQRNHPPGTPVHVLKARRPRAPSAEGGHGQGQGGHGHGQGGGPDPAPGRGGGRPGAAATPAGSEAEARRLQEFQQGLERARQEAQRKLAEEEERRRQPPPRRQESGSRSPSPGQQRPPHDPTHQRRLAEEEEQRRQRMQPQTPQPRPEAQRGERQLFGGAEKEAIVQSAQQQAEAQRMQQFQEGLERARHEAQQKLAEDSVAASAAASSPAGPVRLKPTVLEPLLADGQVAARVERHLHDAALTQPSRGLLPNRVTARVLSSLDTRSSPEPQAWFITPNAEPTSMSSQAAVDRFAQQPENMCAARVAAQIRVG